MKDKSIHTKTRDLYQLCRLGLSFHFCVHLICGKPKLWKISQRVFDAIVGDRQFETPYCEQGQRRSDGEDHIASPLLCVVSSWLAGNGVTVVNDDDVGELDAI